MTSDIYSSQLNLQLLNRGYPIIQWYPGHIAKADQLLSSFIASVDLIIEVRDARVPFSSAHPKLKLWCQNKQHLLVLNRRDMISDTALQTWDSWLKLQGEIPWWCDAKLGNGIKQLKKAITGTSYVFNNRRMARGMKARPVRAVVLGFPNVGKSALINRLVKKKIVASARRAGITRSLNWVRVSQEIDLLDSPGILPPRLDDQRGALLLAICDNIGESAYNTETTAIELLRLFQQFSVISVTGFQLNCLQERYHIEVPVKSINSIDWLKLAADHHTNGNLTRMSQRLLEDFRQSYLGPILLELPPVTSVGL
uniref:Mitochondrial GTPase 1 n=1 Tax=Paulinella longichromatophora TaxID=1708747 RepID=A0A2H4ZP93_9EUKA|nr:hypothetical protein PLO_343 [Paulinella longichromatophora]